jgi:hypothetical protein
VFIAPDLVNKLDSKINEDVKSNRRRKKEKKKIIFRFEKEIFVFEFKKVEKCKINKRKMRPTPRSITHRNPIKISPLAIKASNPIDIKYKPPKYQDIKREL